MTVPDDGKTYGRISGGWQPVTAADPVTGDVTITSTDGFNLMLMTTPPGSWPGIAINLAPPPGGGGAWIGSYVNWTERWEIDLGNNTAETGGNVGNDFQINRHADNGAYLDSSLVIVRSTGHVYIANGISMASTTAPGGPTDLSKHLDLWGGSYGLSVTSFTLNMVSGNQVGLSLNWNTGLGTFFGTIAHHGSATRQGTAGAYTGHNYNFDWTGAVPVWIDTTNVGNITLSSDYRIKQDITPLPSMWERVKLLNPISYQHTDYPPLFEADGKERWGFIAHELQEVLIEDAATGSKDEDDCIQSPNLMTVVATLTRALQEAMARIEALEATHG